MLRNIALANRLDQLCKGVAAILASPAAAALPVDVANLIETARQAAVQLLGAIIEPTFGAIAKLLEQCIRQIHYEDYSLHTAGEDAEGGGGGTVSGFISDLQRNSNHVQTELISRFTCKDAVAPRIKVSTRAPDHTTPHYTTPRHATPHHTTPHQITTPLAFSSHSREDPDGSAAPLHFWPSCNGA